MRELASRCDAIVVVGDDHSSNSKRLREVAQACDRPAYLVNSVKQLEFRWFESYEVIGLTSGASVPEILLSEILSLFEVWWPRLSIETLGDAEQIHFRLPRIPSSPLESGAR